MPATQGAAATGRPGGGKGGGSGGWLPPRGGRTARLRLPAAPQISRGN